VKAGPPEGSLDQVAAQVLRLLVDTFDFPEDEGRRRMALWQAEQHRLEGDALAGLLPLMTDEERAQAILRHVLEGHDIAAALEPDNPAG